MGGDMFLSLWRLKGFKVEGGRWTVDGGRWTVEGRRWKEFVSCSGGMFIRNLIF
jgi:hypothetical protein